MVGLEDMSVEVGLPFTLAPLDTLILGSDGLFDNLQLEEIIACARSGPLAGAVTKLAERSLSRMAKFQAGDSKLPSKPDDLTIVAHRLR